MERMRIEVGAIIADTESKTTLVMVNATSARKIAGRPVASIQLSIQVPTIKGEPVTQTRERAKDEALRFLDVE